MSPHTRLEVRPIAPRRRAWIQAHYCRRQASYLSSPKRFITPVLLPVQFGDGRQLIALRPITTRTHHYVVAIHSMPDLNDRQFYLHDDLDIIYEHIREHFGDCTDAYLEPEDGEKRADPFKEWPAICLDNGCEWWQLANHPVDPVHPVQK